MTPKFISPWTFHWFIYQIAHLTSPLRCLKGNSNFINLKQNCLFPGTATSFSPNPNHFSKVTPFTQCLKYKTRFPPQSLIPYIYSIRKSCWINLQNILYFSPFSLHLHCHHPRANQHQLLLDPWETLLTGFSLSFLQSATRGSILMTVRSYHSLFGIIKLFFIVFIMEFKLQHDIKPGADMAYPPPHTPATLAFLFFLEQVSLPPRLDLLGASLKVTYSVIPSCLPSSNSEVPGPTKNAIVALYSSLFKNILFVYLCAFLVISSQNISSRRAATLFWFIFSLLYPHLVAPSKCSNNVSKINHLFPPFVKIQFVESWILLRHFSCSWRRRRNAEKWNRVLAEFWAFHWFNWNIFAFVYAMAST